MMATDFFNSIPKITEFIGVIDDSNFYPVPEDWVVVVADICSSTQAILFDLESSQHVHFVDGDDGGFCSASLEFKQQLASHE